MVARGLVEEVGFQVKEAANVEEAVALLESGDISLVLTDVEMPGDLNGVDLTWMIRARWPQLPVVVTSGRLLPKIGELPPQTLIVTKPFSPDRLISVLTLQEAHYREGLDSTSSCE
jgi:two-component system, response regulator PdtaR